MKYVWTDRSSDGKLNCILTCIWLAFFKILSLFHLFSLKIKIKKVAKITHFCGFRDSFRSRGRRTWSRLPARSVLLYFVQRSPPEPRTPQHAPRASESKSFYSMPKQKRSPFGNRFRFGRGRGTWSRLPARSVLLYFVQRSPPETRTPQHAPHASESKSFYSMPKQKRSPFGNRFRFGRGRGTWSRLPARSVLLYFVQRSPPETRTPQHAPHASESKSFYSMPKQKRSPFGNRFRFVVGL